MWEDLVVDLENDKKGLTEREKDMVVNIYKYVKEKETKRGADAADMKLIHATTAEIAGIGVPSVYRILEQTERDHRVKLPYARLTKYSSNVSYSQQIAIRRKIYDMYLTKEVAPTGTMILNAVNQDERLPNFKRKTFNSVLKHLQFKYLKQNGRFMVVEKCPIIEQRRDYLEKMKVYRREGRRIYYLDEVCVNAEGIAILQTNKKSLDPNPAEEIKKLTIGHIGNENGFLQGAEVFFETATDNHKAMMTEHFESWFEGILPKLGQGSVVVMDYAAWHSRLLPSKTMPNESWKKDDIQDSLIEKEIDFDEDDSVSDLLNIVRANADKYITYAIDDAAKNYKVEILRYPCFHEDLNPIVDILGAIKAHFIKNSFATLEDAKKLLLEGMGKFPNNKWKDNVKVVLKREAWYNKYDTVMESAWRSFVDDAKLYGSDGSSGDKTSCSSENLTDTDEEESKTDLELEADENEY